MFERKKINMKSGIFLRISRYRINWLAKFVSNL